MNSLRPQNASPAWLVTFWRYLRGDMTPADFAAWVYVTADLERLLPPGLYLQLLETRYQEHLSRYELEKALLVWLEENHPTGCFCLQFRDLQKLPIGSATLFGRELNTIPDAFLAGFVVLKRRTPWLELIRCRDCGQAWYLATDSVADDLHLQRLAADETGAIEQDDWPDTFAQLAAVWPDPTWLRYHGYPSLTAWQRQNQP
ncbi:MAG: hypothetical protein KDE59_26920 [Anaerolineales bacterium]|nr:hypothetical protein [Anaerolineales bacterium]